MIMQNIVQIWQELMRRFSNQLPPTTLPQVEWERKFTEFQALFIKQKEMKEYFVYPKTPPFILNEK